MTMQKAPPICPSCGNNACLLDPDVYARKHLMGLDWRYYLHLKLEATVFAEGKMAEHRKEIEEQ